MNLKKIGKVFTSKFVGTGPSSCKKKKEFTGPRSHKGWETLPYSPRLHFQTTLRRCCTQYTVNSVANSPF